MVDNDEVAEGRPAKRTVVLHPRTAAARRFDRPLRHGSYVRGHTADADEVLDLMRQQWRTSLRFMAALVLPLLGFLTAIVVHPPLRTARLGGMPPLPWLVLGPAMLFGAAVLAFVHERRALRIENEWSRTHRERRT